MSGSFSFKNSNLNLLLFNAPDEEVIDSLSTKSSLNFFKDSGGDDNSYLEEVINTHLSDVNPHNITPAGIGALSKVEHDISLTGDGTAQSPLSTNVLYAEVTALGNIASFYINQDINGNPFSLKNGETIEIVMAIDGWVDGGLDRINVRVNDISDTVYKFAGNTYSYFFTWGAGYKMGLFRQRLTLLNNKLYSYVFSNAKLDNGTWVSAQLYAAQIEDLELTEINSLLLYTSTGDANIPAGTKVYIKKYKI